MGELAKLLSLLQRSRRNSWPSWRRLRWNKSGFQRVFPTQLGKAMKVTIRAVQNIAAFDCEGGQMSVGGEISRGAQLLQLLAKLLEMILRWGGDVEMWECQPVINTGAYIRGTHGVLENISMS